MLKTHFTWIFILMGTCLFAQSGGGFDAELLDYYNETIREKAELEKKLEENKINQEELHRLSQLVLQSQNQIQNLQAGSAIKDRRAKVLREQLAQLRDELRKAKKNKEKNERLIKQLNREIAEANLQIEILDNEIKRLKKYANDLEGDIRKYQSILKTKDSIIYQQQLEIFALWQSAEYSRNIAHLSHNYFGYNFRKKNFFIEVDIENNSSAKKGKLKKYGAIFNLIYIPSFYELRLNQVQFSCYIYRGNQIVYEDDLVIRRQSTSTRLNSNAKFVSLTNLNQFSVARAYLGKLKISRGKAKDVFSKKGTYTYYIFANDNVIEFGAFSVE